MDSNLFSKFWITLALSMPDQQISLAVSVAAKVALSVAVFPQLACIIKLVISDLMYTCKWASVLLLHTCMPRWLPKCFPASAAQPICPE